MTKFEMLTDDSIYEKIVKEYRINEKTLEKYYGSEAVDIFIRGSSPLNRTEDLKSSEMPIYLAMVANCKAISDIKCSII